MDNQEKARIFLKRFFGRQDVYGVKWYSPNGRSGYKPVCRNYGQDFCHIKLKDKVSCSDCAHKEYPRIDEESVLRHILGEEEHIYYMLLPDSTIKFGAIDFDYKEGKENEGYTWEDVKKVSDFLRGWSIEHHVARSTTKGFHIYFFFDDFTKASDFRAVIFEVFEHVGFMEELRRGVRPLPEVFPKQVRITPGSIGNGIKPPMIEPMLGNGRNCFVTTHNKVIEDQWSYLKNAQLVLNNVFVDIIKREGIEVEDYNSQGGSTHSEGQVYKSALSRSKGDKWQPPMQGYMEKMVEGCAALSRLRGKMTEGYVPNHHEGFALYHMAMRTLDGLEWFEKNVPGWAKTEKDKKQLQYSIDKNYGVYTCKKLQEIGVCIPGTKCFERKPPKALVEGKYVGLTDVPKDQWPEPSPIRYALGRGEDCLKKLMEEIVSIKKGDDENTRVKKVKQIIERSQVFDKDQQKALKEFIKSRRVIKASIFHNLWSKIEATHEEFLKEKVSSRDDVVDIQGTGYKKIKPYGYSVLKLVKNKVKEIQLCDCDLILEEEQFTLDENGEVTASYFNGKAIAKGIERDFSLEVEKWYDAPEFIKYFGILLGSKFNVLRGNIDNLRQAAIGFSAKNGIQRVQKLSSQGWYQCTYIMPSIIIDKEGPHPNTERHLDLNNKTMAKNLDFEILSDEEFSEVAFHLKNDFMNAWPRPWTMFGLSHALLPVVIKALGVNQKPTLYFEGDSGCGKSELIMYLQQFYGHFNAILDLTSSGKGVLSVSHDFKDAMLALDDYKGIDKSQKKTLETLIQYSYNYSAAVKLRRDSSQQPLKEPKALLLVSGEQFISNEISMVSRCILIETATWDTRTTRENYRKVMQMSSKYCGILPRFIHWFLNQDLVELRTKLHAVKDKLYDMHAGKQNSDRVSLNLALNFVTWVMWCHFLQENGFAAVSERDQLIEEHWANVIDCQESMLSRCGEEMTGMAFQRVLHQIIVTKEVVIENLQGFQSDNKPVIGFIPTEGPNHIAYLYPDLVFRYVKNATRDNPINVTLRAVGRQLFNMGVICDRDKDRATKMVRHEGVRKRVWAVNLQKLGFMVPHLVAVGSESKKEQPPFMDEDYEKDREGLY